MASLEITIIILTIVQGYLAGYYYKEVDGTYDVYYGDKAFWGYKELKPPKSMKTDFDMRGDRPGMCGKGDFICQEPYSIKETEAFECDVDYQCPRYFKCCKPNCFQHKICQPALETDKENSEPTSKNLPTSTTPPKTIKTVTTKKVSPVISTKASTTAPTPTSTSIRTTKASTTKKPVTTTKASTTAPTTTSTSTRTTKASTTKKPVTTTKAFTTASTPTSTSTRTTKASTTKKPITTTKTSATVYSTTTPTSVASTTINITTTSLMPTTNPLFSTTIFNTSTLKPTSTTENKTIKPGTIPVTEPSIAIPSTKVTEVTNMYTSVRSTPASLATEAVTTKSSPESSSTNIPLTSIFTTESVRTTLLTGQSNSTIATTSLPVLTTQAGSSDLSTNNFNTNTSTKTINTLIFLATTKPYPSTTLVPLMNRTLTSLHTKREQFTSTNSIHDTVNTTTVATDSNISLSGKTKNIPSTFTFTTSSVKATFLTIKPNSTIETTTSVPVLTTSTTIRILDFTNTTNTDNIKTTRKTVSTSTSSANAKHQTTSTLEPVPNTTLTSFQPTVSEQFTNTQSIHDTVNATRVTTIRHNISSPLTTTKETTISHMTSDDEDLTFSGDHEITDSTTNFKETTDVTNYTVMPKPTSTELTLLTTIERTSDEVILSTELFNTTPKWSTDNLTTRQLDVTVKYNTSVTKQSLNDTTDDEDLTFSGDSELVTEDFHSEYDNLSTETTLATANLSTKSLESLTTQDLSFTNESTTFNILPLINETAEWTIPVNNLLTIESITTDYNTTRNTADTSHSNITQQTTDDNFTTAVFKATTSDITENKGLSTINSINSSIEYDAPTSKSSDKTTSSTSSTIEINNITISQFATDDEDLTYSGDGSGYGTDRIIITEDTTTGDVNVSEDDIIFITDNEYNFKQLYSNKTDVSNIANTTNEDTQIYTISEENEKLSTTPIHRETTNTRVDDIFSSSSKSLLTTARSGVTTSTGPLIDTGTGVVIINNLLGELRKIPSMIENGSNNSTNHYFTTFLEFMFKLIPIFKDNKSGTEPDHTNLTGTTEPTANNSTTFEYDQEINDIPQ